MTIKDVEQLTGITRQNIRFYEREGLIAPCRNPENQYREYSADDVRTLKRIRLYRKLDVCIEDIRKLENRTLSLENCMEQCISNTEREMVRMTKIKEVCEELRKKDLEGKSPDVEKTLEQIDAYEKSGYQFTDISKDYWSTEVVHEVRNLNRQVVISLLFFIIVIFVVDILYFLLSKPQWLWLTPCLPIGYTAAWLCWAGKNKAILRKHIHVTPVPAGVYLASAVIGILSYMFFNSSMTVAMAIHPSQTPLLDIGTANWLWLFLILIFSDMLCCLIACILFYDTCKQKSIISALALSSLLFALIHLNLYAAIGYLLLGLCLALLYEITDSFAVCMTSVFFESACTGVLGIVELYFPNTLPEFLGTRSYPPVSQILPWLLIAILMIVILLYAVSRATGKKIDWKQEWEKARSISRPSAEKTTILDPVAFHEIEKDRKRSYRIVDGYFIAAAVIALWYMTRIL